MDKYTSMTEPWRPDPFVYRPPETPREPMEFLSRSWSLSATEVSKALTPPPLPPPHMMTLSKTSSNIILEDLAAELEDQQNGGVVSGNPFSFASSETSQMIMERIMSQSQEVSPRTSGRLSHSSGPLNGGGSLTDSPPVSPSDIDDVKYSRSTNSHHLHHHQHHHNPLTTSSTFRATASASSTPAVSAGGKTVGRWLKDRREKKKEETRVQNAQLHAAISVAGVAAAVAAIAAATAASSGSGKDEQMARTDMAVASAATLVAAQCVEAAESMGAEREHLASVVGSAVNVRSAGDIMTLTAGAATALRGAATLKARALKEVWNIAAVIPVDKGVGGVGSVSLGSNVINGGGSNHGSSNGSFSGELAAEENFLGICSRELLARGCELLKRTRKGDLHLKVVSVYINRCNQVMLKMKSKHVAGTITKKKKNIVVEVIKDMPAWPGRHLLEGGENRRYFGLKTIMRGVVEFECRSQREYDIWTQGVSRLLSLSAEKTSRHRI